jgi:hypothetical protein
VNHKELTFIELTAFGVVIVQGNNEISFRIFSVRNVCMDIDRMCAGQLWRAPNVRNVPLLYMTSAEPLVYNTL